MTAEGRGGRGRRALGGPNTCGACAAHEPTGGRLPTEAPWVFSPRLGPREGRAGQARALRPLQLLLLGCPSRPALPAAEPAREPRSAASMTARFSRQGAAFRGPHAVSQATLREPSSVEEMTAASPWPLGGLLRRKPAARCADTSSPVERPVERARDASTGHRCVSRPQRTLPLAPQPSPSAVGCPAALWPRELSLPLSGRCGGGGGEPGGGASPAASTCADTGPGLIRLSQGPSPPKCQLLHALHPQLWIWTVNSRKTGKGSINLGISGTRDTPPAGLCA